MFLIPLKSLCNRFSTIRTATFEKGSVFIMNRYFEVIDVYSLVNIKLYVLWYIFEDDGGKLCFTRTAYGHSKSE